MSPNKTTGRGTKVTLGKDAPIKEEGAGNIPSESLAAESNRAGGGFASNAGSRSEIFPAAALKSSSNPEATPNSVYQKDTRDHTSYETGLGSSSNIDTAPTYVNEQLRHNLGKPHGKNLHEGFDDAGTRDGMKAALNAEIGSEDDPSRVAEHLYEVKQNARGQDAGPRETSLKTATKYESLKDESA